VKRIAAPQAWRAIDFISDIHLSADQPRTFDAWRAFMSCTDADAVFILGDLFEVWIGDDARGGAFEASCIAVLRAAAQRLHVTFMAGNRDFFVGRELLSACGVAALPDPVLLDAWGLRVVLTHGDALCLADVDYQRFRELVRSDAWRRDFLDKPLDERRSIARELRDASARAQRGRTDWADVDAPAAVALMRTAGAREMVHGHTHRPGSGELAPGFTRHVLSDWDLDSPLPRSEVLRLTHSGFVRRSPAPSR
jgi:UDP-2,3-diacylglucosamine hydrolase